jgi:cytochrome c oxidase assembly factor CtaG
MSAQELLVTAWDWEPSIVIGCALLAIGYAAIVRKHGFTRAPYFLAGVLLLLLDLVSPIDALGDQYLFSAHILQHFFLALVIPPLLLLGVPRWFAAAALEHPAIGKIERTIGHPPVSWVLGVGVMLAWHIPVLFNAALADDTLHIFQHLSFLVTGTIFWWPILAPIESRRLPALGAVAYLFSACLCCSLLGAFLTFAPVGLYPAYLHPPARDLFGLDPKSDQQLGGLLMWVPGCFVYLTGILATLRRWYGEEVAA